MSAEIHRRRVEAATIEERSSQLGDTTSSKKTFLAEAPRPREKSMNLQTNSEVISDSMTRASSYQDSAAYIPKPVTPIRRLGSSLKPGKMDSKEDIKNLIRKGKEQETRGTSGHDVFDGD
jgi:hypothetical protein